MKPTDQKQGVFYEPAVTRPPASSEYCHRRVTPGTVMDDGEVSPIDNMEVNPYGYDNRVRQPQPRKESHIPVPRRDVSGGQGSSRSGQSQNVVRTKQWTQNVGKSPMMWDDYLFVLSFCLV